MLKANQQNVPEKQQNNKNYRSSQNFKKNMTLYSLKSIVELIWEGAEARGFHHCPSDYNKSPALVSSTSYHSLFQETLVRLCSWTECDPERPRYEPAAHPLMSAD